MPRLKKIHEDPVRVAEYAACVTQRRADLRAACAQLLADRDDFVLELGCGHGHFLTAYAAAHPDRLCLGIDLVLERIARANRKRERARLANVHFLRADAADFFSALPERARFSAIYVLFPDPWPKRRHHKHRIMRATLIAELAARAGEGTRLYFRTDHAAYFTAGRAALAAHGGWRLAAEPWPFEMATVFSERAAGHHSLVAVRTGP